MVWSFGNHEYVQGFLRDGKVIIFGRETTVVWIGFVILSEAGLCLRWHIYNKAQTSHNFEVKRQILRHRERDR